MDTRQLRNGPDWTRDDFINKVAGKVAAVHAVFDINRKYVVIQF